MHAVNAVFTNYAEIQAALNDIGSDSKQSVDTRVQANALASKMNKIETVLGLMTEIWHTVLERINAKSLSSLQKNDIDILTAVQLYKSLLDFTVALRETFDDVEETAKSFVADSEYKENSRRKKRRKTFFDEAE
jgi:hypothetical protein